MHFYNEVIHPICGIEHARKVSHDENMNEKQKLKSTLQEVDLPRKRSVIHHWTKILRPYSSSQKMLAAAYVLLTPLKC